MNRRLVLVLSSVAATGFASVVFSRRPPMPVLVGTEATGERVPLLYQLFVFPAFGATVGGVMHDAIRGDSNLGGRIWILTSTGCVAVARLQGRHGLSGHVVFTMATLIALGPTQLEGLLAAAGLLACIPYKLGWGDGCGLLESAGAGLALGGLVRATSRLSQ